MIFFARSLSSWVPSHGRRQSRVPGGGSLGGRSIPGVAGATASLLWTACRPVPNPEGVARALRAGADLRQAADAAIAQRVSPLLWRTLRAMDLASVASSEQDDAAWAGLLQADASRCRAQAALLLPRIGPAALAPLAEAGLEPLVFKGAALAGRYPAPGLRPMDDIDLILPPEQYKRALPVLQRAGWRVARKQPDRQHTGLVHHALPGLPLDLHRAFAIWREHSSRLTSAHLWARRQPGVIADVPVFVVPPEEELVTLAAHAAKPFHIFERLIWAVDVAVVVAAAEASACPVDWDGVKEFSDAVRCRTALAVMLTQAARLGVDSPEPMRRCSATGTRRLALAPLLSADWPLLERDKGIRTRLRYALVDDWRQGLALVVGQVTGRGVLAAPRQALALGTRGIRRWWRLRHQRDGSDLGGQEPA